MKIDIVLRTAIGLLCVLLVLFVLCSVIFEFQGFKVLDTSDISLVQADHIVTSIAIVGVIIARGIYYVDMCVYAKQLYKYNQKNHGLISEYRCLIAEKEKKCERLEKECFLLFSEKSILEKSTQQDHKDQICKLQGKIDALYKEMDEIKYKS